MEPFAALVIRTESSESLEPLLDLVFDQDLRDIDVWIASPDELRSTRYPIRWLPATRAMTQGAVINELARRSQARYLVSLGLGVIPRDRQWLGKLLRHFQDTSVAAVSGTDWNPERISIQAPHYAQDVLDFLAAPIFGLSLANAALRRDLVEQNPFDESLAICEDKEWGYRLLRGGYSVMMDYEARCHAADPLSAEEQFKRYWAMNLSFSQFIHPSEATRIVTQKAFHTAWARKAPAELMRAWRLWMQIRQQSFWQRSPTQAFFARLAFQQAKDKWAV